MKSNHLSVTVVYAPAPREVCEIALEVLPGTTVREAITASRLQTRFPDLPLEHGCVGIWGRKTTLDLALQNHDRVEIWRPLSVDPKVARRERFSKQGARSAGLFAKRRTGAKSGY